MGDVFFKALRWAFFVTFMIAGLWAFQKVGDHGVRYVMMVVLSFGAAYLMAGPWRNLPPKPMVLSIIGIALIALAARFVPPDFPYILFGVRESYGFFVIWGALTFLIGIPFMMIIFSKYDK